MNNSAEAEKYYLSKKWGNPSWDRKTATMFGKSEMFDFAEYFHQYMKEKELSELTDEVIEGMFPGEFMDYADTQEAKRKGAKAIRDYLKQKK